MTDGVSNVDVVPDIYFYLYNSRFALQIALFQNIAKDRS